MPKHTRIDKQWVAGFCKRHRVRKLSLFGSVLRDDIGPDSDIELLVEFEADADVTPFDTGAMRNELHERFGRDISLCTPQDISRHFRDEGLASAEVRDAA